MAAGGYAFYWTQSGGIVSLGSFPGSTASSALAIDSATGQIVGAATDSTGTSHIVFFNYNDPGTLTPLANMPAGGGAVNGSIASTTTTGWPPARISGSRLAAGR